MWLVDGSYMYKACSSVFSGYKLDYPKLRRAINKRFSVVEQAHYFNSVQEKPDPATRWFLDLISAPPPDGAGFELHLSRLRRWPARDVYCERCRKIVSVECPDGNDHEVKVEQQKGVDVGLATIALTKLEEYDRLVLSSGDGDLVPALAHVKKAGRVLTLVVFQHGVSSELRELADGEIVIDKISREVGQN
jgi:uncharacterized LabA/DUF88 family protein